MINFWKLAYKSVKEQRNQHKVELQQCKSERHHYKAELESYKTNLKQRKEALELTRDEVKKYKAERDTLIDDLSWYKAKVSRLERENRQLSELNKQLTFENINCEHEIKALREQNYKYCKLGNHIRLKAEMNPSVDRYIELKNFITRLEKGE